MRKITFLGDMLCEAPFRRAALQGGLYHFEASFEGLREKLRESDYTIANLETPIAGAASGYADDRFSMYSMNAPDEFAKAIKNVGIDLVLTANNHCCDRKIKGLIRTLDTLDSMGLKHTGTYRDENETRNIYIDLEEITISLIACTASTNENQTGVKPTLKNVDILRTQGTRINGIRDAVMCAKTMFVTHVIGSTRAFDIKKRMLNRCDKPVIDDYIDTTDVDNYLNSLGGRIRDAQKAADIVFVCPHMGGQFNANPGRFSEYTMKGIAQLGVDAIVGGHPHVVQKHEKIGNTPCFYSIGNATMSLSTKYILKNDLPEYGIMVHFYVESKRIARITFSIIKITENEKGYLFVNTVSDLYCESKDEAAQHRLLKDSNIIASRVLNKSFKQNFIQDEYIV